ncbi:MAG: PDZ domain-containing protein, partial [Vicinamibacterales bacterium]
LVDLVVSTKPGTTVPVTIYRGKQRQTMNVTVGELDLDAQQGQLARGGSAEEPTATGFGMEVGPVTPEVARELNLERNRGGAVIVDVDRNSPAFYAGLRPSDVILEVNQQPVSNVSQVQRELQRATAGQPVFLVVWRATESGGQENFVTMTRR